MNVILKSALCALVGVPLLAATSVSVAAAVDRMPTQVTVRYDDLDLATAHGAQVMYHRLNNAARSVCGDEEPLYLEAWHAIRMCQRDAIQQAVQELDRDQLTNVYHTHTASR
jgi:UrcA family protein